MADNGSSILGSSWHATAWPSLTPRAKQVAYMTATGWGLDDIAREFFVPAQQITRIREIIRQFNRAGSSDFTPFAKFTGPEIDELTAAITITRAQLDNLRTLSPKDAKVVDKLLQGETLAMAGHSVYGYPIETGSYAERLFTEQLGVKTLTQLRQLVQATKPAADLAAAANTATPGGKQ